MARVLVVSDLVSPFPGGAEAYLSRVCDALAERGHTIHIITSYAKAKTKYPTAICSDLTEDELLGRIHLNVRPYDLLLSHHYFMEKFKHVFDTSLIPFVEIVHSRDRNPHASFAIFNSQYTARNHGFREGDMVMLPPVDNSCIAHGDPFEREYIGHVKPLYGKGIGFTYRLTRIMCERKFLVLRGEWQDLEQIEKRKNVEYMEPCADMREFYARCRVVVMPSLHEDAGTIPLECALNGIPCISSDAGGLVETNFGGVTLPLGDPIPWLTEVCKLDSRVYYDEFVRRQRMFVNTLDWSKQFDEIDRKVRELCARS